MLGTAALGSLATCVSFWDGDGADSWPRAIELFETAAGESLATAGED